MPLVRVFRYVALAIRAQIVPGAYFLHRGPATFTALRLQFSRRSGIRKSPGFPVWTFLMCDSSFRPTPPRILPHFGTLCDA